MKDIENAMVDTANNHTALQVRLDEVKYLIGLAEKVAEVVAPNSEVAHVAEAVEGVIDAVSQPEG